MIIVKEIIMIFDNIAINERSCRWELSSGNLCTFTKPNQVQLQFWLHLQFWLQRSNELGF
jgi:hypothetical protein